jgi:hypothetical protein
MDNTLRDTVQQVNAGLCAHYEEPLRMLARRAVRVWFNHERLDQLLADTLRHRLRCDLLYAINSDGRQLSSNVWQDKIDSGAYGQDLSQRPYSVTTSILNNAAYQGVFLCDAYVSQVTRRPCITLMCGVTCGPTTLGFIAADLDLHNLPAL